MRIIIITAGLAGLLLTGCGGSDDSAVYDESEARDAAAAIARGEEDVTIRGEDGEEIRVQTGDTGGALPGGLPPYPGASRTGGTTISSDGPEGGSGQFVMFMTDDSPEEVIAFYREAIEGSGRTISATVQTGQMQSISVTDEDNRGGVQVTATDAGTGTSIMIAGGRQGG